MMPSKTLEETGSSTNQTRVLCAVSSLLLPPPQLFWSLCSHKQGQAIAHSAQGRSAKETRKTKHFKGTDKNV